MKEIQLPINQTISVTFTSEDLASNDAVDMGNGVSRVSLGTMIDAEISDNLQTARKNGGTILYATTSIEQQIENILLKYFMGDFIQYEERREIFEKEILQSSALSYSAKKELLLKIVNNLKLLQRKKKEKLQKCLKDIMVWRNAFAHGNVRNDTKKGCFIKYYSGCEKEFILTDSFWLKIENGFNDGSTLLKDVADKLNNKSA